MSSSIFIESPSESRYMSGFLDADGEANDNNSGGANNGPTDLVIFYDKNNKPKCDQELLEKFVADETNLSTVSVIRITSPTPSMEAEDIEKYSRTTTKKDSANTVEKNVEDALSGSESSENADSSYSEEEELSEGELLATLNGTVSATITTQKVRKKKKKILKEKPKPAALHIVEYYPPDLAKKLAKDILTMSGINPQTLKFDKKFRELQLLALANDHCYTPWLSPTQTPVIEKGPDNKVPIQPPEKIQQKLTNLKQSVVAKQRSTSNDSKNSTKRQDSIDESPAGDEETDSDFQSESESESVDTDNDRDSDLDFSVYGSGSKRKIRKTKRVSINKITKKQRRQSEQDEDLTKKKARAAQRLNSDGIKGKFDTSISKIKAEIKPKTETMKGKLDIPIKTQQLPTTPLIPLGTSTAKNTSMLRKTLNESEKSEIQAKLPMKFAGNIPSKDDHLDQQRQMAHSSTSSQMELQLPVSDSGKAIVQNVVIIKPANPGFTDLSKYLSKLGGEGEIIKPDSSGSIIITRKGTNTIQNQQLHSQQHHSQQHYSQQHHSQQRHSQHHQPQQQPPQQQPPQQQPPQQQPPQQQPQQRRSQQQSQYPQQLSQLQLPLNEQQQLLQQQQPQQQNAITAQSPNILSKKGFIPLTQQSKLPSQISIQSHEDKELIDSLVNDELLHPLPTESEMNITNLVKMLQSTEESILQGQRPQKHLDDHENNDHIDQQQRVNNQDTHAHPLQSQQQDAISHFSDTMSNANVDEITEDFLKDVAELIDPKTLDELVKKQALDVIDQNVSDAIDFEVDIPSSLVVATPPPPSQQNMEDVRSVRNPLKIYHNIMSESPSTIDMSPDSFHIPNEIEPPERRHDPMLFSTPKGLPIQVIQRNGRVITLPPIEAPTTRAKRRAATAGSTPSTPQGDGENVVTPKPVKQLKSASRRSSKENKILKASDKKQKRPSTSSQKQHDVITTESSHDEEEYIDDANDADFNEDDDPDKLWCICRQPHNNRFMICCDICEEWFHGTCVNVTKAMGLEMEQRGLDWTCPKCSNKGKKPLQRKISEIFEKKNMVTIPVEKEIFNIQTTLVSQINQPPAKRESTESGASNSSQTRIVQKKISDLVILKKIEVKSNPGLIKDLLKVDTRPENEEKEVCKKIEIQKAQKIIEHPKTQQEIEKCVVCRRQAREKTVYCSDECLRKYIHNVVSSRQTGKAPNSSTDIVKKKSSFEEALGAAAVLTPQKKIERVSVFERKTGRVLTGGNAPTLTNLKRWLQENQNFEVVQPGSQNTLAIETKKRLQSQSSVESNLETSISPVASKNFKLESKLSEKIASSQTNDTIRPKVLATSILAAPLNASSSALSVCPTTSNTHHIMSLNSPKVMLKVTPAVSNKSLQKSQKNLEKSLEKSNKFEKEKNSDKGEKFEKVAKKLKPKQDESSKDSKTNEKDVRSNIVKNFREQITTRMSEISEENHAKLTEDEIEQFAQNIEKELYSLYNKDASSPKYRNKFRSLQFNLRDRKNTTLFHKICAKIVDAKQLVRMTPEELASQELAAWRQQESKHQLELVKNSELDLLQCSKNYVLKTHKGEEVIEAKTTDRLNLDISQIPVEDVVTILNSSTVSSTSEEDLNETQIKDDKDSFKVDLEQYDEKIMTESDKIENLASKSKNKTEKLLLKVIPSKSKTETSKKEKNHDKHERSKNSEKSRERERSKEREKSRDRDYREKHKKDRHKEKSKKRSRSRSRERRDHSIRHHKSPEGRVDKRQNDKHHDKNFHDPAAATSTNSVTVSTTSAPAAYTGTVTSKTKSKSESLKKFNLVDQILKSISNSFEESANIASNTQTNKPALQNEKPLSHPATPVTPPLFDSDQEPTSTVQIPTPPSIDDEENSKYSKYINSYRLWSGSINMIDVATFQIIIQPVSGIFHNMEKDLSNELDVVGRISPETVWDYIAKIKKSANKEIVIVRLLPSQESEYIAYLALYMYLDKRRRLGVVRSESKGIKDFYILPLNGQKYLPSVLQSNSNVEFFDDDTRPDLLLGIIIRVMEPNTSLNMALKRPQTSANAGPSNKMVCTTETSVISNKHLPSDEDTPSGSPRLATKNKLITVTETKNVLKPESQQINDDSNDDVIEIVPGVKNQAQSLNSSENDCNDDEPYSPGGSSEEAEQSIIPGLTTTSTSIKDDDELKRKMDEINRQIEREKMELAGMLGGSNSSSDSFSNSASAPMATLANIKIPSNLQQILASIQKPPPPPTEEDLDLEEYNPEDPINSLMLTKSHAPKYISSDIKEKSGSRLAQLTEAELLSMVPDDIDISNPVREKSTSQMSSKSNVEK